MDKRLNLNSATIENTVILSGSRFSGIVSARSATIGELALFGDYGPTSWSEDAFLSLQRAEVRNPVDFDSYTGLRDRLDLQGFTYNTVDRGTTNNFDQVASLDSPSSGSYIDWLRLRLGHDTYYLPQPYEKLAVAQY